MHVYDTRIKIDPTPIPTPKIIPEPYDYELNSTPSIYQDVSSYKAITIFQNLG